MSKLPAAEHLEDAWRHTHLGRLLGHAMRKFDERVRQLMAQDDETPLALFNLAARQGQRRAHSHHAAPVPAGRPHHRSGRARGHEQAGHDRSGGPVRSLGLVLREADAYDRRAKRVVYTDTGRAWHLAFQRAVQQAEREFEEAVGHDVAVVVRIGLEVYGSDVGDQA